MRDGMFSVNAQFAPTPPSISVQNDASFTRCLGYSVTERGALTGIIWRNFRLINFARSLDLAPSVGGGANGRRREASTE